MFDLHMKRMGITWFVDLPEAGGSGNLNGRSGSGSGSEFASGPGSKSEKRIATVAPRWDALKDKFDVLFRNAAPDSVGEDIKLEVRGQDIWKLRINVYLDGKVVMTAKRTEKLSVYLPGIPPQWSVDVAEGMDLSVVRSCLPAHFGILTSCSGVVDRRRYGWSDVLLQLTLNTHEAILIIIIDVLTIYSMDDQSNEFIPATFLLNTLSN